MFEEEGEVTRATPSDWPSDREIVTKRAQKNVSAIARRLFFHDSASPLSTKEREDVARLRGTVDVKGLSGKVERRLATTNTSGSAGGSKGGRDFAERLPQLSRARIEPIPSLDLLPFRTTDMYKRLENIKKQATQDELSTSSSSSSSSDDEDDEHKKNKRVAKRLIAMNPSHVSVHTIKSVRVHTVVNRDNKALDKVKTMKDLMQIAADQKDVKLTSVAANQLASEKTHPREVTRTKIEVSAKTFTEKMHAEARDTVLQALTTLFARDGKPIPRDTFVAALRAWGSHTMSLSDLVDRILDTGHRQFYEARCGGMLTNEEAAMLLQHVARTDPKHETALDSWCFHFDPSQPTGSHYLTLTFLLSEERMHIPFQWDVEGTNQGWVTLPTSQFPIPIYADSIHTIVRAIRVATIGK